MIGIICGTGSNLRFFRTVFADELRREYLRTALAKGSPLRRVYGVHLIKNAMVQIITRVGAGLPFIFTGSLLLESFFGIPGLGFAGTEALYDSDIQMLKALVLLSAILFVIINLLTDIAYAWADPRIKLE
jgi:peptide/nickel transport system permease protein